MENVEQNLAELATVWSCIFQAQETVGDQAAAARNQLLLRYHEAVYNYLLTELRDPNVAGEIFSNFAERVLEVHKFLKRADPERGRFRDYLKVVLRRMIIDHYRAKQRKDERVGAFIPGSDQEPGLSASSLDDDRRFIAWWRQQVINQTWKALEQVEQETGQPYASVLRHQVDNPKARAADIAEHFTAQRGKPFSPAGIRQIVHRAREKFGSLLIQEVAHSIQSTPGETVSRERLEQEMIELNLLFSYCKDSLEHYGSGEKA